MSEILDDQQAEMPLQRMSDRTVRRILREDLDFHPHEMVMVQAINDQDIVNRKAVSFC